MPSTIDALPRFRLDEMDHGSEGDASDAVARLTAAAKVRRQRPSAAPPAPIIADNIHTCFPLQHPSHRARQETRSAAGRARIALAAAPFLADDAAGFAELAALLDAAGGDAAQWRVASLKSFLLKVDEAAAERAEAVRGDVRMRGADADALWRRFPSVPRLLEHFVVQITFPDVDEDVAARVFPLALAMMCDHERTVIAAGTRTLHHLVRQVTPTQAKYHEEGIRGALQQALGFHDDEELLAAVMRCAVDAVPAVAGRCRAPNGAYDEMLERMLQLMEMETKVALLTVCMAEVGAFVAKMDIFVVRFSKRLLDVIFRCLLTGQRPLIVAALAALQHVIRAAMPRITAHEQHIATVLARVLRRLDEDEAQLAQVAEARDRLPRDDIVAAVRATAAILRDESPTFALMLAEHSDIPHVALLSS